MARIELITGGCRSGKSARALALGNGAGPRRVFIATMPVIDQEMRQRVARHRSEREGKGWLTVEAPLDLAGALAGAAPFDVAVIDCLTLWISNLLFQEEQGGAAIDEEEMARQSKNLVAACREHEGMIVLVTNEVGWGIVPENPLARRFRDLAGRCNQIVADGADAVTLMCSGLPLYLKRS